MQEMICYGFTCAAFFLLSFISFFNPVKVNIVANRWLSVFLFSAGCVILNVIIYRFGNADKYTALIAFDELSRFAMSPALYISVLHFTNPDKSFRKSDFLHFMPFALFFIWDAPAVFNLRVHYFNTASPAVNIVLSGIVFYSVKIQLIVYWILAYNQLNRHQKNIRQVNSNIKPVTLNWLKFVLFGIIFMTFLWLNEIFFRIGIFSAIAPVAYVVATLFICYYLLAQKEVYPFEDDELEDIESIIKPVINTKEVKQRLSDEEINSIKSHLVCIMEHEKIYLDNELNLPQLAKKLKISSHDLSYVLNQGFNKNFFEFVNAYRVDEAKKMMLSGKYKHLNILGIAYSSGFNSKTTFNISFKKETRQSPTQFIQQHRN